MSLTLAGLLTIAVVLLLFVSFLELSEPEHTWFFFKNKKLSPTPASVIATGYGVFKNRCQKYGFSKRAVVQKDGSFLSELNAEITNITNGMWALKTPELSTMLTPGGDTVYPGKKTFHIGDCVTITYLVEESGRSVVTQVTTQ